MKETYLSRDFRETAAQRFPSQAKELNAFFDTRLNVLLAENADASKEKQYHLQRQILPGIAAYETLQRVMPKEEALQIVHGYVEELARTSHKQLAALLHIPGLYRLVPGVFVKSTRNVFGPAAGFDSKELQVGNGIWRVDTPYALQELVKAIYIEAPYKSSGKRHQGIRISYDLVGFIPVEELLKQETA